MAGKAAIRARTGGASRDAVLERARELGLLGWVRDDDGVVRVHAEGAPEAVDALAGFLGDDAEIERHRAEGHEQLAVRGVPAGVFDGVRGLIVETPGGAPPGTYLLGDGDAAVEGVDGASEEVEDVMDVARRTLETARDGVPSALWVVATPGLELLPPEVVEAKLRVLADGARQARLYLAKEQFD
jgi:acylphosphatase